jgi:hypothetical protein
MSTMRRSLSLLLLAFLATACSMNSVVSYETVQSFKPAQGSILLGYSNSALDEATRLSEVRAKCGTPLQEWEDTVPFFNPKLRHLKYKTYDPNRNVINAIFTFVETSSDPSLIAVAYDASSK